MFWLCNISPRFDTHLYSVLGTLSLHEYWTIVTSAVGVKRIFLMLLMNIEHIGDKRRVMSEWR